MVLDQIIEDKKIRLIEHKEKTSFEEVRRAGEQAAKEETGRETFFEALKKPGLSVIGEFKQASPSLGNIKKTMELPDRIAAYNQSVDAISCLTEEDHFHGNIDYFKTIRNITPLPMLRKDFMIDPYQFYEAKAIGADAILLIAAILDEAQMKDFYQLTRELKMDALVEVHSEKEVEKSLRTGCRIIGVNNRDLRDFTIRLDTTKRLRQTVPSEYCFVSESGLTNDEEVRYVKQCGVDACLVGRALMETDHPELVVQRWKDL